MNRRGAASSQHGDSAASGASAASRERLPTAASLDRSPSSHGSTASREGAEGGNGANGAPAPTGSQFISIRSRVGKRFQATLPELREKPVLAESDRAQKMLKVMHLSKPRYSLDRANALGGDLEKYLKLARSLRDGSTFDTDEQITCLALQYLHRFDYNTTDAACSLYARHSMEVPKHALPTGESTAPTRANNPAEIEAQWITAFYRTMRLDRVTMDNYNQMAQLLAKAATNGIAATELGVLERLVNRFATWLTAYEDVKAREVDRVELEALVYQAEDLMFDTPLKLELEKRLQDFDSAYGRMKDAFERNNRRNQTKCDLEELEEFYAAVVAVEVNYPEKEEFTNILAEARDMKSTIMAMLAEEKVNLTAMREVIARIELVPVNFEKEVDLFQQKMLNAQSWLAKVRKCIPKRRASRRGGPEPKKMDLQAIRALVDDAPCEDSAEMYEMQDLLECADEWAEKVKEAIEGGADVSLDELKELREEGDAMPVDMDEQKFLEAEISAREWCTNAAVMLAAKKPFQELEDIVEEAKEIRKHLHTKKQSRWKPQIERDIHAALDTARRWINEIRDTVGQHAFDKIFNSGSSHGVIGSYDSNGTLDAAATASSRSEATEAFVKGKKPVDCVHKLLEKAEKLVVNVDFYTSRLQEILSVSSQTQLEAFNTLVKIGVRDPAQQPISSSEAGHKENGDDDELMPPATVTTTSVSATSATKPLGDFSQACSVLDKVSGLPVVFDEAIELFQIVHAEREWADRVREAIPPRQSRKKRMSKHITSLDDLIALQDESQRLRFHFPEELRILSRELEDLAIWQQKAKEVVAGRASAMIDSTGMSLKEHDMLVFERFTEAKKKLMASAHGLTHTTGSDGSAMPIVKSEAIDADQDQQKSQSATSEVTTGSGQYTVANQISGTSEELPLSPTAKAESTPVVSSPVAFVAEPFKVDEIIDTIQREAGCQKRSADSTSEDDAADLQKKSARTFSVLDPLLTLVEESVALVNAVETKDDKKKLDELLLSSTPRDDSILPNGSADEAVKQLELWHSQISSTLEEGCLFNAVAPEQHGLSIVIELLEWLQSARSIFYNEALPIKDLVMKGSQLETRLNAMRAEFTSFDDSTIELLQKLLWPLPYLVTQDRIVQAWMARVKKSMEDKHAPIEEIQKLLSEAYSLLLEPDSFKIILDELKKAKLWLAKLKKRLKGLMTKQVTRLTMAVAKSLVEEGEEIAIELPAFDMLKEHVDLAVDWEKRVLASGLENGQARIANLVSLLDEYDRARLVIDLDMHRDVLKSATERYCVCRQPYDGFMIGCDYCDDWFHDNCIGMSKEKAEKVENYTCPSCSILQELKSALLRAVESQPTLWTDNDYGKSYEKQHAATQRKIKREEKAVERSEMLLFSCNNHMNQLRARIDDIERAKSCFTTLKNPFEAAAAALPSPTPAAAESVAASNSAQTGPTSAAASLPVSLAVTLPLGSAAAPTSSSTSSAHPAIPNVPMDTLAFVQRYPNILLPSAKFGVVQGDATKPQASTQEATSTSITSATSISETGNTSTEGVAKTQSGSGENAGATVPPATAVPDMMPNMLAPMLAKLSENRERLSALLVAGGVEQQLTKMKSEHGEVKAQVEELQVMIRIGKERLAATQANLDDLKRAYVIRQHGLPRAKSWIHRVIRLINTPSSLLRHKFTAPTTASDDLCFLSPEFTEVLTDAKAKEISHFPEVKVYETLLRAVGWALVTVSLLQERPSRETLMVAIVYANEHHLIDPAKAVAPLRSIIGRVDVWITKAHKTLGKQASQTQKATRLKALLNEYTKLPLTCSWVRTLEDYMRAMESPDASLSAEESVRKLTELEAAAVAAIFEASTTWLPAPNPKIQRKRKPYTKKDKSEGGADGDSTGTPDAKQAKKAKVGKAPAKTAASAGTAGEPDEEVDPPYVQEGDSEDVEMADAGKAAKGVGASNWEWKVGVGGMPHRQLQQRGAIDNEAELDQHHDGFAELQQFENDVKNANERGDPDAEPTEDDFDDDLARWQQHVLERPREGLRSLDIMFASSGYDYLTVLSLPNNSIDDITPIARSSKTLRLLNLNANVISRLPSQSDAFWPKFRCLSLLFLSGNSLATWRAMEGLIQCPKLLWLTVDGNPIMSQVNAREFLINKLPTSLKALNDHVITDVEYIKHAGRSIRFGAQNVRLFIGDALCVPSDFDENEAVALDYVARTEATIHSVYAHNSPSMITQRVVRGHLSRQRHMPLYKRVRRLVVRVQATIRGYLFRRGIRAEFAQLVTQQGQQDLLVGPMDDALFMTGGAHRGLRKLVALVQQWRVRYRAKKQAIAVKKIRFWCQMVYQRYRYRSQQLLHDHQEIFIYYTASFEGEILEMALKTFHRDPVLMTMSPSERETLMRQRCIHSGVSVLRSPSQSRVVMASPSAASPHSSPQKSPPPTAQRIQRDNLAIGALKKTLTPPLVRIFRKDQSLETNVLVTEKQLIQQDLTMLKRMKKQTQQETTRGASHRAMLVQIAQLTRELEQRLVIVNRKILTACLKHQQQCTRPRMAFSLSHVAIRVRGHAPTRSERRKMNRLMPPNSFKAPRNSSRIRRPYYNAKSAADGQPGGGQSHRPSDYTRMRVFIPWSIDMYMQMMASLDRALLLTNVSASFALSYEQTRQIHAATAIQSAWRAGRCHCKRDALEVTILRAVVCVQRWWRHAMGLGRRMAFLRACLLTCGAVNSPTLFMEAPVHQVLSDSTAWTTQVRSTMRHCKEQGLHCLMVDGAVEISLSPSQMMLFAASGSSSASAASQLWAGGDAAKVDAVSAQRCGAYLPVWLSPGAPEHFEESMVSRDADATPHLLVDRVHVEPTIIERELLLVGSTRGGNTAAPVGSDNPYTRFAACRQVVGAGTRVMELARKFSVEHRKATPTATDSTASATSFVRLTFDSVEEARHRALVLLAKTFDPISHSYARLYSVEALVGATMLRHQWAVAQAIGDPVSGEQFLSDCRIWLEAEIPSAWAVRMQQRMPQESLQAPSPDRHSRPVMAAAHHQATATVHKSTRSSIVVPHRPAPPPLVAVSPMALHVDGPAPLHIAESFVEKGIQPVPPSRPSVSSPSPGTAFSRHQLLTDRLGKPAYETLDDMRHLQTKDRDMFVRDRREERERAAEALIVDKRMIQREHAAELAGIHLEMHVKLQKIKYEQELTKIHTRELVEREKMNEHTRKLTHQFEKSFVAQSGAMMRNAARRAVETKLVKKEATRKAMAAEIRERDEAALERRQDAKSYWFVSNQKTKQRVDDTTEMALATREKKEKKREQGVRQRIKEDKEIKKMLRLM